MGAEEQLAAAPPFPPVSYEAWRDRVQAELGDDAERRLHRITLEGLTVEALYSPDHLGARAPLPRLARPVGPWRIWQEIDLSARETGRAALAGELDRDLGGVWLRADRQELTARDVAAVAGECLAREGIEVVLEGAEPLAGAALLVAGARIAGQPVERLHGCLGCDPLGELARRGALPEGNAGESLVAAAHWARDHAPSLAPAIVSTAPYVDAGADAVQEIAFALATGAEVLRWLRGAGFSPEHAAGKVWVSASVGRDLYLQLAKLRALRLGWGMLLASHDAPVGSLRLHARTARRTKGLGDPGTDLVRATIETLAAVLAGCSDVTCAPVVDGEIELALGAPLGSATQLLLRDEVGLDAITDPASGSWYVESLTAALARRAWELFEGIERRGGMTRELAVGGVAGAVADAAERRRRALVEGRLPIVGVTLHRPSRPVPLPHRPLAVASAPQPRGMAAAARVATTPATALETMSAAIYSALGGATLAELGASRTGGAPGLRAPALASWRDEEAVETRETA